MKHTLREWAELIRTSTDTALFCKEHGSAFFVADPDSVFSISRGPISTLEVDFSLLQSATSNSFIDKTPAFGLVRREDSIYNFISVGRTENCDIPLRDDSVSKLHAIIRKKAESFTVQDAAKRNPTLCNNEPVSTKPVDARELNPGDVLSFGNLKVHFHNLTSFCELLQQISLL